MYSNNFPIIICRVFTSVKTYDDAIAACSAMTSRCTDEGYTVKLLEVGNFAAFIEEGINDDGAAYDADYHANGAWDTGSVTWADIDGNSIVFPGQHFYLILSVF